MKRIILIFLLVNTTIGLFAQSEFYYAPDGGKEYFKIRKDKVILKLKSTAKTQKIAQQAGIASTYSLSENRIIATIDTLSIKIDTLKIDADIADVAYLLEYADGTLQAPTDKLFVKLKSAQPLDTLLNQVDFTKNIISTELINSQNNIYQINLNVEVGDVLSKARELFETDFFEFVEPSFLRQLQLHNTYYSNQWALKNTGQNGGTAGIDIHAEAAWNITQGSANIKIAVIDEGVDLTHPDLQANLLSGFDATGGSTNGGAQGDEAHGTACAGIIGAINNTIGVVGVAPDCKIVPVRIGHRHNGNVWTEDTWIIAGIHYAWSTAQADVLSNSWGGGSPSTAVMAEINEATTQGRNGKGCVVVFSSGNNNASAVNYPSYLSNVIAVGAITRNGQRASFSNYGERLNVVAPGVDIYTTDIQGSVGYNTSSGTSGNYYGSFSGTSAACPHVAGVAALMLSGNPDLTQARVCTIIESTAQKVGGYSYQTIASLYSNGTWNEQMGYGLVNAYAAVLSAAAINGPAEICTTPATYTLLDGTTSSWSVSSATDFQIVSSTSTSVVVKATNYNGVNGVITAVVNGVTVTKAIKGCRIYAAGSHYICTEPETYALNTGYASSWSVTPTSVFQILNSAGGAVRIAATSTNGEAGTITAVVNGVPVTRTIHTCISDLTISGTSVIGGADETYVLSSIVAASGWSVTPTSAFEIVMSAYSAALVRAKNYNGTSGTLSATVNGLAITKAIQTCQASISGDSNICFPQMYSIFRNCSNLQVSSWSITGPFNISSSGNNVGVTPITTSSETTGTLTATFPSGAQLSKQLYKCASTTAISSAYSIYPNPASSVLFISSNQLQSGGESQSLTLSSGGCSVQLVSVQSGALELSQAVSSFGSFNLNVAAVPNGQYVLRLMQGNEVVHTQMVMVQH
jgi:subtilisin family serine protease